MDFEPTVEQKMIIKTATEIAQDFGPEYWREKDKNHQFPAEFWKALAEAGFHGMVIPEKYGGSGLGMLEMALAMDTLAAEGCGLAGPGMLVLTAVMASLAITKYGSEYLKEKYLPKIAKGEFEFCIGITEPDAGTNTLNTKTFARKEEDGSYTINGQKIFISGADHANGIILVTRTTPLEKAPKKTFGISLFVIDLPNPSIEAIPIEKHGLNYINSCEVYLSDVRVPKENLLGEEGKGWYYLLDMLNPERISFAAACTGTGMIAIKKAVEYARERNVFGVPIGRYQAIQFPLAEAKAKIEAARLMTCKAAKLYDEGKPCGAETNMAKVAAVEAGTQAVYHAMQTFGGYGYAVEYDVERWWREINLVRLAPVTQQMALAFIGERVLGLPRSY